MTTPETTTDAAALIEEIAAMSATLAAIRAFLGGGDE
jgi:hypothetical protein